MSVRIVVDSTADLRAEVAEQVTVVPLTIRFGEEEYIDGVTIDSKGFYEKLGKLRLVEGNQPIEDATRDILAALGD